MKLSIIGHDLPGHVFPREDGSLMSNVHVGVQVRNEPAELVRADQAEARWTLEIELIDRQGELDFRGPAVQGSRGERFIYLTWGDVTPETHFERFRRAKLMLNRIDAAVMAAARDGSDIVARVDLTGSDGGPRCARVDPPGIAWSVADR